MTRFLSFFVFAFGVILLALIGVMMAQRWINPKGAAGMEERTVAPHTEMPPLNLGTKDQFDQHLDQYYEAGGIASVGNHVKEDLVPGRLWIMPSTQSSDPPVEMVIIDREMRQCDADGTAMTNVAPLVPRATADAKMGDDVHLSTFARLHGREPSFYITTWWVSPRR